MNDYIDSAIVYGVFKPKIYMSYSVDYSEIKYLYEHECMHIQHKHHIIKLIVGIAVVVNWFNPLLWMFYKRYMEYIELVCDYDCCKNTDVKKTGIVNMLKYCLDYHVKAMRRK